MAESDDEDIRRHKERINKNFSSENAISPIQRPSVEEEKRGRTLTHKRLLSDSSNDDGSDNESTPVDTPDQSRQTSNRDKDSDLTVDFARQIMQLFPKEKLYEQKFAQINDILKAAIKYSSGNASKEPSNAQLKKELSKWKEEAQFQANTIKRLENTIIESKKENIVLIKKIEKLEETTKHLEYSNLQQRLSADLVDMLKSSYRLLEEDNKQLKETIKVMDDNHKMERIVWEDELHSLKQVLLDKKQGLQVSSSYRNNRMDMEDIKQTIRRGADTPESNRSRVDENDSNHHNTAHRDEYMMFNHPDSVSSKSSMQRSNLSRGTFDTFIKESNVMKESLLKHI